MTDFAWPTTDSWSGSELERFATRAEEATDSFVEAANNYITVDAAYQRVRGTAYAQRRLAGENHSASERMADQDAIDEMIARRAAEVQMEAQKSLMRTRLAVLSAAQTHQRAVDRQT